MTVRDVMEELELFLVAGAGGVNKEVTNVHICDHLMWIMQNATKGSIWITMQSKIDIVGAAAVAGISCIIVSEGTYVERETVEKANDEGIPIFASSYGGFELARQLIKLGL